MTFRLLANWALVAALAVWLSVVVLQISWRAIAAHRVHQAGRGIHSSHGRT